MSGTDTRRARLRSAAVATAIVVVTLSVYLRVAGHQLLWFDDDLYVHDNPWVRGGLSWAGTAWAFTTFHAGNWHPLTWISHMLDVQLFGLEPAGHHVVNVLLHALNAALLYLVVSAMTRAPGRSAVVALLFAAHPLHVESVAWVAERKDVLSTSFGLLALGAYAAYAARPTWARYVAVAAAFAASLMAKPMWVTFPFLLLLLDFWPLQRVSRSPTERDSSLPLRPAVSARAAVLEKVPLLLMSAASSLVTFVAQDRWGAVFPLELGLGARAANAVVSYVLYLSRTFWPWPLAAYYPLSRERVAWQVIAAATLLVAITAGALATRGRPWRLVGWLWFLGTLVPVIGLVQVGGQAMADRYTYVPIVGLFVAVVWDGHLLVPSRWRAAAASGVIAALSAVTWVQSGYWTDDETLFRHAIAVTENNALAHFNLGTRLVQTGRLAEARPLMARAAQLDPAHSGAWNALGNFALLDGDVARAVELYRRAAATSAVNFEARYNLATSLARLGRCQEARRADPRLDAAPAEDRAYADFRRQVVAAGDPLGDTLRRLCP